MEGHMNPSINEGGNCQTYRLVYTVSKPRQNLLSSLDSLQKGWNILGPKDVRPKRQLDSSNSMRIVRMEGGLTFQSK